MRVNHYKTMLGDKGLPVLVKEKSCNYACDRFGTPSAIVQMMRDVYQIHLQTEEFVYELCFTTKMKLIGIFEISHGIVNSSFSNAREIFQKALICGASTIVIVHNHPSGESEPSELDRRTAKNLHDAGEMLGVCVADNIVICAHEYYSFRENE